MPIEPNRASGPIRTSTSAVITMRLPAAVFVAGARAPAEGAAASGAAGGAAAATVTAAGGALARGAPAVAPGNEPGSSSTYQEGCALPEAVRCPPLPANAAGSSSTAHGGATAAALAAEAGAGAAGLAAAAAAAGTIAG